MMSRLLIMAWALASVSNGLAAEPSNGSKPEPSSFLPADAPIPDARIRELLTAIDAGARTLATGPDWIAESEGRFVHNPASKVIDGEAYSASWHTDWKNKQIKHPSLRIRTSLRGTPRILNDFLLEAHGEHDNGWHGLVNFSCGARQDRSEHIHVSFRRDDLFVTPEKTRSLVLHYPYGSGWTEWREEKKIRYQFSGPSQWGATPTNADRRQATIAFYDSPESMRDVMLEHHDKLEGRLHADIASGAGFQMNPLGRGDRFRFEPGEKVEFPDAVKAELKASVQAEMKLRRAVIEQHYQEMHAAAIVTFPALREIVAKWEK